MKKCCNPVNLSKEPKAQMLGVLSSFRLESKGRKVYEEGPSMRLSLVAFFARLLLSYWISSKWEMKISRNA